MTTLYHTPHNTGAPLTAAGLNVPLGELDAAIANLRSGPGPLAINGGFTNSYLTDLWIAAANYANPVNNHQAIYSQLRISGNVGALVHDGAAFEIRLDTISNTTFLNAVEASVVITGGANTIANVRAITGNMHVEGGPTGTVTDAIMVAAQAISAVAPLVITNAYGVYVDQQTVGTNNFSIYAPTGVSVFGELRLAQVQGAATDLRWYAGDGRTAADLRWVLRRNTTAESGGNAGSNLELLARSDAGAAVGTALTITRSNLAIMLGTGPLGFFGTTPVAKKTGWGAATGTATRTTFATGTVTTAQLAEHVKALLDDLLAYGLISA